MVRARLSARFVVVVLGLVSVAVETPARQGLPAPARDTVAAHGVVAAAHPLAAKAGLEVLQAGGNAVDAAIATALTLGSVEPNASGLGGGGFALVYMAKAKKAYVVDYRETAPGKARPDTYQPAEKGQPADDSQKTGYRAVAVPGELRGLEMLHRMFATRKWADLFKPAIGYAEGGITVSETLAGVLTEEYERVQLAPAMPFFQKTFYKDGLPAERGDIVRNPDLARTLRLVAAGGGDVFYRGEIANAIVREFAAKGGGWITKEDLAGYKAVLREPITGTYRGRTIIALPPPSAGGVMLLEMLNVLEGYDLARLGAGTADFIHTVIETHKLAFADRLAYLGDPAFVNVPVAGLISKPYAAERRKTIDPLKAHMATAGKPGSVPGAAGHESGSTTSFSVVDREGNVVTITQTIEEFLGAAVVAEGTGVLLNDEMNDFDRDPSSLNAPGAGKRPLSSISPIVVLQDGKPFLTLGSPGGPRIATALLNIVTQVIDFHQDLQAAIVAPRFHNGNAALTTYEPRIGEDVLSALEARGHQFTKKKEFDLHFGGAQGVMIRADGRLVGGADPRRDGVALGY